MACGYVALVPRAILVVKRGVDVVKFVALSSMCGNVISRPIGV